MYIPVGNSLIPRTTPLHIYQLLLLLIKETFREVPDGHPFKYTDDFNTTGITFDTVFNKESEVYGKRPVVIVSRGDVSQAQIATGDVGGGNLATGNLGKTSLVRSSTIFKIISARPSQVDILANEIFSTLVAVRAFLPSVTSITHVDSISLGAISPFDEGDHMYYCASTVQYVMQYKWSHKVTREVLASIHLNLSEKQTHNSQYSIVS